MALQKDKAFGEAAPFLVGSVPAFSHQSPPTDDELPAALGLAGKPSTRVFGPDERLPADLHEGQTPLLDLLVGIGLAHAVNGAERLDRERLADGRIGYCNGGGGLQTLHVSRNGNGEGMNRHGALISSAMCVGSLRIAFLKPDVPDGASGIDPAR